MTAPRRAVLIGCAYGLRGSDAERTGARGAWDGSTGTRLARLLGVDREELPKLFELVNLFDAHPMRDGSAAPLFPRSAAKVCAWRLAPFLSGRAVVMAGREVAAAYGVLAQPWGIWRGDRLLGPDHDGVDVAGWASVPHLSGLTMEWRRERTRKEFGDFLRAIAASPDPETDARLVTGMSPVTERPSDLVGYRRAAEILGLEVNHLRVLVHRKQIDHHRVSARKVLFRVAELQLRLLAGHVRQSREAKEQGEVSACPVLPRSKSAPPSADESQS